MAVKKYVFSLFDKIISFLMPASLFSTTVQLVPNVREVFLISFHVVDTLYRRPSFVAPNYF